VLDIKHEDALRQGTRARKSAEDLMEIGSLKSALDEVDEALKAEANARKPQEEQDEQKKKDEFLTKAAEIEATAGEIMIAKIMTVRGPQGGMTDEETELIKAAESKNATRFGANVSLCVTPTSEKKVREFLESVPGGKPIPADSDENGFVGVFCDPAVMGEPVTSPHIRIPPVNVPVVKAVQLLSQILSFISAFARCFEPLDLLLVVIIIIVTSIVVVAVEVATMVAKSQQW